MDKFVKTSDDNQSTNAAIQAIEKTITDGKILLNKPKAIQKKRIKNQKMILARMILYHMNILKLRFLIFKNLRGKYFYIKNNFKIRE